MWTKEWGQVNDFCHIQRDAGIAERKRTSEPGLLSAPSDRIRLLLLLRVRFSKRTRAVCEAVLALPGGTPCCGAMGISVQLLACSAFAGVFPNDTRGHDRPILVRVIARSVVLRLLSSLGFCRRRRERGAHLSEGRSTLTSLCTMSRDLCSRGHVCRGFAPYCEASIQASSPADPERRRPAQRPGARDPADARPAAEMPDIGGALWLDGLVMRPSSVRIGLSTFDCATQGH